MFPAMIPKCWFLIFFPGDPSYRWLSAVIARASTHDILARLAEPISARLVNHFGRPWTTASRPPVALLLRLKGYELTNWTLVWQGPEF